MRPSTSGLSALAVLAVLAAPVAQARGQIPEKFENLQYFPKDISRDSLVNTMRGFSFALGVRCQYCHTGGDGVSFAGVNFASDDKPAKRNARFMLRMVDSLNGHAFNGLPQRRTPAVRLECVTCHRGSSAPTTLARTLAATLESKGVDSAVAQYRMLRRSAELGRFDFGEWSMNEFVRSLREQGKITEAIAMLELNGEFYKTTSIDGGLAELYMLRADTAKALERYRMFLEKQPNNPVARRRVEELTKKP
jgi:hypothetical protein